MEGKFIGYINLYYDELFGNFLHWAGRIYKTENEALKYKDKDKVYFLGEVFIKK